MWIVMFCTKSSDLGTHLMPVEDKTVKLKKRKKNDRILTAVIDVWN